MNYIGALQQTMMFRKTVISQELSAQYAIKCRMLPRVEAKGETIDARIRFICDVEILKYPTDIAVTFQRN